MKTTNLLFTVLLVAVLVPHIQACWGGSDKKKEEKEKEARKEDPKPVLHTDIGKEVSACGRNYLISHSEVEWNNAKASCESISNRKYSLFSIESEAKQDCIVKTFNAQFPGSAYEVWTSGSDLKTPGRFRWMSTKEFIDPNMHSSWAPDQPDNQGGSEHCVTATFNEKPNTAQWFDKDCENKFQFICQASST